MGTAVRRHFAHRASGLTGHMRLPNKFRLLLRSLLARNKVEQELDEELQYYLEREIEKNIAAGMSPENARQQALRAVGPIPRIKQNCRDVQGLNWIEQRLPRFSLCDPSATKESWVYLHSHLFSGLGHLHRSLHFWPRRSSADQPSAIP